MPKSALKSKKPVAPDLFRNFQVFTVLDDNETFGDAIISTIQVFPSAEDSPEEVSSFLDEGRVPLEGHVAKIDVRKLLNEALAAKLPCVADLAKKLK